MSSARSAWTALVDAVRATVAYADLFDFPIDEHEICRDLIGVPASLDETREAVAVALVTGSLILDDGFVSLPDRTGLAALRRIRTERAARLWPIAYRFGRILATLPYVRMVGVSGSLAAGNPDDAADIDYFIVSIPGRLWLARAGAVALVRLAHLAGIRPCPNYLLSTRALALAERDLYTAHELLQVVPVAGFGVYQQFRLANAWTANFLPNRSRVATPSRREGLASALIRSSVELALPRSAASYVDGWEARRKAARLATADGEARFTADVCEGHYGRNRRPLLQRFAARCRELEIPPPLGEMCIAPDVGRTVEPAVARR